MVKDATEPSRFNVVETLTKQPGCCFICRSIETPMLDTNHWIVGTGTIYLCKACVSEFYETLIGQPEPVETVTTVTENAEDLNNVAGALNDISGVFVNCVAELRRITESVTEVKPQDDKGKPGEGTGSDGTKSDSSKPAK